MECVYYYYRFLLKIAPICAKILYENEIMSLINNIENSIQKFDTDIRAVMALPSLLSDHVNYVDNQWLKHFFQTAVKPTWSRYEGNRRLGFYYQWLWRQFILAHPQYELIAEEVQIYQDKQTLGAIDFLVREKQTQQIEHWEVAIKFYLQHKAQWLGPNANDQLEKKTARMVSHQLLLTEQPAYQQQWQTQFGQPEVKRLIMQGRLFTSESAQIKAPDINPNCAKGLWCFAEHAPAHLRFFDKSEWLSPPRYQDLKPQSNHNPLTHSTQAIDENNQVWFVMPSYWPNSKP